MYNFKKLLPIFCGCFFFLAHVPFAQNNSPLSGGFEKKVTEFIPQDQTLRQGQGNGVVEEMLLPPPPGNDNCASATVLSIGANCISGSTNTATTQGGEYLCINPGGGITPETVWYRFTATNDSLVLGFIQTNSTNCATVLAAYGPFAPGAGCLPGSGNQRICQNMALIDPGFHPLLTGLVIGQDYLVQVQGNNCGGSGDRFSNFCIGISNPAANGYAGGASVINNCGVAFVGSTSGGHWANGTSIGANNLDNNVSTTAPGTSEAGDDVTFVINNLSWFTFCNGNTTSCNWSIVLNGISGCQLPAPNAGVQAAIFTGNPTALTSVVQSPSIIPQGGSWASGNFAVAASTCVYIAVDGFAGDECNYNLTLTNSSCPCALLPLDLAFMAGRNFRNEIRLDWEMNNQESLHHFELKRGVDGQTFTKIAEIQESSMQAYQYRDLSASDGWNYYQLSAITQDGNSKVLKMISVFRQGEKSELLNAANIDNNLHVTLFADHIGTRSIQIIDLQGRQLLRVEKVIQEGMNRFDIDISNLPAGIFVIKAEENGSALVQKFVKNSN